MDDLKITLLAKTLDQLSTLTIVIVAWWAASLALITAFIALALGFARSFPTMSKRLQSSLFLFTLILILLNVPFGVFLALSVLRLGEFYDALIQSSGVVLPAFPAFNAIAIGAGFASVAYLVYGGIWIALWRVVVARRQSTR